MVDSGTALRAELMRRACWCSFIVILIAKRVTIDEQRCGWSKYVAIYYKKKIVIYLWAKQIAMSKISEAMQTTFMAAQEITVDLLTLNIQVRKEVNNYIHQNAGCQHLE